MKRKLNYKEVCNVIDDEDKCGVNNLLQEIFSYVDKNNEVKLGEDIDVIGEFDSQGFLGKIEVIKKKEQ